MRIDFSRLALKNRAFSDKPMTFVDKLPKEYLSAILDLAAIETGNRAAREYWQQNQLQNLLIFAAQRSDFWRARIGSRKIKGIRLSDLAVQTRKDVVTQVENEGSLTKPNETGQIAKHSTSGSTGTPVQFFLTQRNANYNSIRSITQFFMEGRDLTLNRTRVKSNAVRDTQGFTVHKTDSWMGPLDGFIRSGTNKHIDYFRPQLDALCKELERDAIGYLVGQPRFLEIVLQHVEPEFFKRAGTAMLVPTAEGFDPKMREAFRSVGILARGNYSSEEVGLIGSECETITDHFHVATSNVLVEVVGKEKLQGATEPAGRILVTNLHSYATPFIRYDIGDIGTLHERCACGHDGPVVSNVFGREKSLLKHADGSVSQFYPRGRDFTAIAPLKEYRVRQTSLTNLVLEVSGRDALTPGQIAAFAALVQLHAGTGFDVDVRPVDEIDWGHSLKRLGFSCDV
jgi:phenylacetate-CoA ligase